MKIFKFQNLQHEHGPDTIHLYTSLTNNILIELVMLQFSTVNLDIRLTGSIQSTVLSVIRGGGGGGGGGVLYGV